MEHIHTALDKPPYDFNKQITCPACIEEVWEFRKMLCKKYKWDEWPEDLKGALAGE